MPNTWLKWIKWSSCLLECMHRSFIKTSTNTLRYSLKACNIWHWKVAGAFVRPNGITLYAKILHFVAKAILCWSFDLIETRFTCLTSLGPSYDPPNDYILCWSFGLIETRFTCLASLGPSYDPPNDFIFCLHSLVMYKKRSTSIWVATCTQWRWS